MTTLATQRLNSERVKNMMRVMNLERGFLEFIMSFACRWGGDSAVFSFFCKRDNIKSERKERGGKVTANAGWQWGFV